MTSSQDRPCDPGICSFCMIYKYVTQSDPHTVIVVFIVVVDDFLAYHLNLARCFKGYLSGLC